MVFDDITGQIKVKNILLDSFESGRTGHAYLFNGPEGIGRMSLAKRFAALVMCMGNDRERGQLCGKCVSCNLHKNSTNPDLIYITETSGKNTISIETIRDMQEMMTKAPLYGRKSFYVIDNAEKMTLQAQNALLKTLEEPPEYVVLILICSNISLLLDTVKSRLNRIDFTRNTDVEIKKILADNGKQPDDLICSYADGIPGRALGFEHDADIVTLRRSLSGLVSELINGGVRARKRAAKLLDDNNEKKEFIFYTLISIYRDIMVLARYGIKVRVQNVGLEEELYKTAGELGYHKAEISLEIVDKTWKSIGRNVNFKLSAELMLINLQEASMKK